MTPKSVLPMILNLRKKFYKDRFNYASFDCAATIIKTNKEAKGAHNILIENKDSYMLNKCDAPNKFVIIELCQDILVDTVVIGSFEFFSSMFKDIRISVSDRFPRATTMNGKCWESFKERVFVTFRVFTLKTHLFGHGICGLSFCHIGVRSFIAQYPLCEFMEQL